MRSILTLLITILICSNLDAQSFLKDVKNNFRNFSSKTTMVVLAEDGMLDMTIREAVIKNWKISPYKFCNFNEYERIKRDTSFFFLLKTDGRYKKEAEPTIEYLSLFKGGYDVQNSIGKYPEIISLPLRAIDDNSGHIISFIPAYITIFQNHIFKIQKGILLAYAGELAYNKGVDEMKNMQILFDSLDFGYTPEKDQIKWIFRGKADVVSSQKIEEALDKQQKNCAVSLVIAGQEMSRGSYCYKLLIGTDTKELYFFKKHKLSSKYPRGFTKGDIKRISVPFQF